MNDLSGAGVATSGRWLCATVPVSVPFVLAPLLLLGTAVSLFILVVVGNALFLAALLLLSTFIISVFIWNSLSFRRNLALLLFVDRMPVSDLLSASDGQLVKITGVIPPLAECGDFPLESSYEKVERCVYTSTLLYEYSGFGFKISTNDYHTGSRTVRVNDRHVCWKLAYLERFTADFYITDAKSGMRALVKAGYDSKVIPLVGENLIVNTRKKNRMVSSTLKKWLEERSLPVEARLLHLKEGFIKEGTSLTVVGMLSKKNEIYMIVPPPDAISTSCLLQKLLLPVDFDGLILRFPSKT
ncbi:uncharacterized membrane protein At1g16860 isoform X2 [Dendrobium catenatum]|uniref:uncharacterized membrane protein At1g16860 isoform X2 n=1 Tax=Dendrobium catenatum TaxID=906689 RepID=UPI0009F596FA|nr:uncharacterized membrane protein At1g16860 isoform X2 [Dendrobium catenatum]